MTFAIVRPKSNIDLIWKVTHKQTGETQEMSETDAFELDKRLWEIECISFEKKLNKPVLIETSLCFLFNQFFGIKCIFHPVYSIADLEGYYI